ncbi:protein kinase [bacterium]|nr:protein kinase [bacterium]
MASFEQYTQQLISTGLVTDSELTALLGSLPTDLQQEVEPLAEILIRQHKLTAYQSQEFAAGRGQGLVLGNYLIQGKLGQGGMGVVFKAEHRRMKRVVAIKVLSPDVTSSPEAIARFHREVQAAARLIHPHVVTAFDADEAHGQHFLVMQYVDGQNLSLLVKFKGPLSVDLAVRYIQQAAEGLQFAHDQGITHRDIKPGNLLVDQEGTVRLLDMGLARLDGESGQESDITHTGMVMGTVDYIAPEQAIDTRHADARSDIYSLGITMWFLLTGRPAYSGTSNMAKLLAHRDAPIPSLMLNRTDVPQALDDIFYKMVAKRPEDRYQSMTEVLSALRNLRLNSGVAQPTEVIAIPQELRKQPLPGQTTSSNRTNVASDASATLTAFAGAAGPRTIPISNADTERQLPRSVVSRLRPPARSAWWKSPTGMITVGSLGVLSLIMLVVGMALQPVKSVVPPKQTATTIAEVEEAVPQPVTPAEEAAAIPTDWPADAPPLARFPFNKDQAEQHQEAWAKYLGVPVEFTNSAKQKYRLIPPGTFVMGLSEAQMDGLKNTVLDDPPAGLRNAVPSRAVYISQPFYMGVNEVTVGNFRQMGMTVSEVDGQQSDDSPLMASVDWVDALDYCNRLSQAEGKRPVYTIDGNTAKMDSEAEGYRLPSEMQWEYACRAGTDTLWHFGDGPLQDRFLLRSVSSFANPFNLRRMYAGSSEWCWDSMHHYHGAPKSDRDVPLEQYGLEHIVRGGSDHAGGGGTRSVVNSFARFGWGKAQGGFGRMVLPVVVPPKS